MSSLKQKSAQMSLFRKDDIVRKSSDSFRNCMLERPRKNWEYGDLAFR